MNQDIAIQSRGIGKQYIIGGAEQQFDSFREMLRGALTEPFRKFKKLSGQEEANLFWALRDIDFDIPVGQITGVIGRNGAGKSTLLKGLSRITAPTVGEIKVRGRVASLLEVGSGFHPELTGRENIYMNASILGMNRQEVHRKLDEIVAFAEVGQFLDTPVKRYSSGMYVRLAFSVAAHVDPDVLFVDEVLAVGDAKFQQRCIGKLNEVGQQGRTVMFVSHNMGLIQDLCSHTIYLKNGEIQTLGDTRSVLPEYLRDGAEQAGQWCSNNPEETMSTLRLCNSAGDVVDSFGYQQAVHAEIGFTAQRADHDYVLSLQIIDELGRDILMSWDTDTHQRCTEPGKNYYAACQLPTSLLRPGRYFLKAAVRNSKHTYLENIEEASIEFKVTNQDCVISQHRWGVVFPTLDWQVNQRDV